MSPISSGVDIGNNYALTAISLCPNLSCVNKDQTRLRWSCTIWVLVEAIDSIVFGNPFIINEEILRILGIEEDLLYTYRNYEPDRK